QGVRPILPDRRTAACDARVCQSTATAEELASPNARAGSNKKKEEMTKLPEDRIPVIVGVGEITDKPESPEQGLEPLALMQEALAHAEDDAGAKLIAAIDSIDLVNFVSWRYDDPARQLCERLTIKPPRAVYG